MDDTPEDEQKWFRPPDINLLQLLLIVIAGANPTIVTRQCPEDIGSLTASGGIAVGAFLYNATLFSIIAARLFGNPGHLNFGLIGGAIGLAAFILTTDSFVFYRCSYLAAGLAELAKWIELPDAVKQWHSGQKFLAVRVCQSCALGLVVGVMCSLLVYSNDISARAEQNYLQNYAPIVQQINERSEAEIKRAADEITVVNARIATLDRQISAARQVELSNARRSGRGARATATSVPQVRSLEEQRAGEERKLAKLKTDLSQLQSSRNNKIRTELDGNPTIVHPHNGILTQINLLEQIAGDDWKIAFIIFLIEICAVGFDLAPVLAKMNLRTTYATLVARDYLHKTQTIVDEVVSDNPNDQGPNAPKPSKPANDNQAVNGRDLGHNLFANDNLPGEQPRRKRGRPRKPPPEDAFGG